MSNTIIIESMFLYQYDHPERGITIGGSQRYSIDLGRLFHSLGYKIIFLTKAKSNTEKELDGWAIIRSFDSPYGEKGRRDFSKRVRDFCDTNGPSLAIYSDIMAGFPYCYRNSIAIQHGIGWDNPRRKMRNALYSRYYLKAMHNFKRIICVDTNFINWVRERDLAYFSDPDRLVYVPNYADEDQFEYDYREWGKGSEFVLLYPRRLVSHRGCDIFLEMCVQLTEKGHKIKPVLAFEDFRENEFMEKSTHYSGLNAEIIHPKMTEIHHVYKRSFLTFIPTIWSEGTSFSAIESISTGCPVVTSDVGGLGNVVFPWFNGVIVPPTSKSFTKVTSFLLENVDARNRLARNCSCVRESFGKKRWERQIIEVAQEAL